MTLAADGLTVQLAGATVLEAVACRIVPGRITGIIGPNGAGKSTLLRTLAGLLPPSAGDVRLDGRPLVGIDRRELARSVAFLPQDRVAHWPLPVRAVAALGRLPHRAGPSGESSADRDAIEQALAAADVAHLAARSMATLSGGERARALLARALAQQARFLLADEPSAGLDPAHALELFAVLGRLAAAGSGVAVVLHDLSLAARFCHDLVVLHRGRVAAYGACRDVLASPGLTAVFGVRLAVGEVDGVPFVVPAAPIG